MRITELWIEHSQARFPESYGGRDINGVCVTSIDTYTSGCISHYMKYEEKCIDLERYQVLQKCKGELEKVMPYVADEALVYFSRLHEMCNLIITEASIDYRVHRNNRSGV